MSGSEEPQVSPPHAEQVDTPTTPVVQRSTQVVLLEDMQRQEIPGETREEQTAHLVHLSTRVFQDPAAINEHLGLAMSALNVPGLADKANQCIGMMIASHASTHLSTLWTVLLRGIREAVDTGAQVAILVHFSRVANRIAIPQRANAFLAFSKVLVGLMGSEPIVADKSFAGCCSAAITSLGPHSDLTFVEALLEKLLQGMRTWRRVETKRCGGTILATLLRWCPQPMPLATVYKQFAQHDPNTYVRYTQSCAIVLDQLVAVAMQQAEALSSDICAYSPLAAVVGNVAELLSHELGPESVDVGGVPVLTATLGRLFDTISAMPVLTQSAEALMRSLQLQFQQALDKVRHPATKTVLRTPLIRFAVQYGSVMQLDDGAVWRDEDGTLEKFWMSDDGDVFLRCEALQALPLLVATNQDKKTAYLDMVDGLFTEAFDTHPSAALLRGILRSFAAFVVRFPVEPRAADDGEWVRLEQTFRRVVRRMHIEVAADSQLATWQTLTQSVDLVRIYCRTFHRQEVIREAMRFVCSTFTHGDPRVRSSAVAAYVDCSAYVHLDNPGTCFDAGLGPSSLTMLEVSAGVLKSGDECDRTSRVAPSLPSLYSHIAHDAGDRPSQDTVMHVNNLIVVVRGAVAACNESYLKAGDKRHAAYLRAVLEAVAELYKRVAPGDSPVMSHALALAVTLMSVLQNDAMSSSMETLLVVLSTLATILGGNWEVISHPVHERMLSILHGYLVCCCDAVDTIAQPEGTQRSRAAHYLSLVPPSVQSVIHASAASVLSSSESAESSTFYAVLSSVLTTVRPVLELKVEVRQKLSPVVAQHRSLLSCFDVSCTVAPVQTLRCLTALFIASFVNKRPKASPSALLLPDHDNVCISAILSNQRDSRVSLATATVPRNIGDLIPQGNQFCARASYIIKRCLAFDLHLVGVELFRFATVLGIYDEKFTTVSSSRTSGTPDKMRDCYRSLDPDNVLYSKAVNILHHPSHYNAVRATAVLVPLAGFVAQVRALHFVQRCDSSLFELDTVIRNTKNAVTSLSADVFYRVLGPLAKEDAVHQFVVAEVTSARLSLPLLELVNACLRAPAIDPNTREQLVNSVFKALCSNSVFNRDVSNDAITAVVEVAGWDRVASRARFASASLQGRSQPLTAHDPPTPPVFPMALLWTVHCAANAPDELDTDVCRQLFPALVAHAAAHTVASTRVSRFILDAVCRLHSTIMATPTREFVLWGTGVDSWFAETISDRWVLRTTEQCLEAGKIIRCAGALMGPASAASVERCIARTIDDKQWDDEGNVGLLLGGLLSALPARESHEPFQLAFLQDSELFWLFCGRHVDSSAVRHVLGLVKLESPETVRALVSAMQHTATTMEAKRLCDALVLLPESSAPQVEAALASHCSSCPGDMAALMMKQWLSPWFDKCSVIQGSAPSSPCSNTSGTELLRTSLTEPYSGIVLAHTDLSTLEPRGLLALLHPRHFTDAAKNVFCSPMTELASQVLASTAHGRKQLSWLLVLMFRQYDAVRENITEDDLHTHADAFGDLVLLHARQPAEDPSDSHLRSAVGKLQFSNSVLKELDAEGMHVRQTAMLLAIQVLDACSVRNSHDFSLALRPCLATLSLLLGTVGVWADDQWLHDPEHDTLDKTSMKELWFRFTLRLSTLVLNLCECTHEGVSDEHATYGEISYKISRIGDIMKNRNTALAEGHTSLACIAPASLLETVTWCLLQCFPKATLRFVLVEHAADVRCNANLLFLTQFIFTLGCNAAIASDVFSRYLVHMVALCSNKEEEEEEDAALPRSQYRYLAYLFAAVLMRVSPGPDAPSPLHNSRATMASYCVADTCERLIGGMLYRSEISSLHCITTKIQRHLFPYSRDCADSMLSWNVHRSPELCPSLTEPLAAVDVPVQVVSSMLSVWLHVLQHAFDSLSAHPEHSLLSLDTITWVAQWNPALLSFRLSSDGETVGEILSTYLVRYAASLGLGDAMDSGTPEMGRAKLGIIWLPAAPSSVDYCFHHIAERVTIAAAAMEACQARVDNQPHGITASIDPFLMAERLARTNFFTVPAACSALTLLSMSHRYRTRMTAALPALSTRLLNQLTPIASTWIPGVMAVLKVVQAALFAVQTPRREFELRLVEPLWMLVMREPSDDSPIALQRKTCGGRRYAWFIHVILQAAMRCGTLNHAQWNDLRAKITMPTTQASRNLESVAAVQQAIQTNVSTMKARASKLQERLRKKVTEVMDKAREQRATSVQPPHLVGTTYRSQSQGQPEVFEPAASPSPPQRNHGPSHVDPSESDFTVSTQLFRAGSSVNDTYAKTINMLHFGTFCTIIMQDGVEEADSNRSHILEALKQVDDVLTHTGELVLMCLHLIVVTVLDPNEALFMILNRSGQGSSAAALMALHLQKMSAPAPMPVDTTVIYIDAVAQRRPSAHRLWWVVLHVLCAVGPFAARSFSSQFLDIPAVSLETVTKVALGIVREVVVEYGPRHLDPLLASLADAARNSPVVTEVNTQLNEYIKKISS